MSRKLHPRDNPGIQRLIHLAETRNYRIIGRSSGELARYCGISPEEVVETLRQCPLVGQAQCGLWGYADGLPAKHTDNDVWTDPWEGYAKPSQKPRVPRKSRKAPKPPEKPAEPTDGLADPLADL
jgi:hypothetical protein